MQRSQVTFIKGPFDLQRGSDSRVENYWFTTWRTVALLHPHCRHKVAVVVWVSPRSHVLTLILQSHPLIVFEDKNFGW